MFARLVLVPLGVLAGGLAVSGASLWLLVALASPDVSSLQADGAARGRAGDVPLWHSAWAAPRQLSDGHEGDHGGDKCPADSHNHDNEKDKHCDAAFNERKNKCQGADSGQGHGHRRLSGGPQQDPTTDIMVTSVAGLCLFFVAFNMFIMLLINYKRPSIRIVTWRMVSTALCIYCAVLITECLDTFLVEQVLKGHIDGPGFGIKCPKAWHKVATSTGQFALMYVGLVVLCNWNREKPSRVACVSNLFGHLVAFAGINFFHHFSHEVVLHEDAILHNLILFCGSALVLVASMHVMQQVRKFCIAYKSLNAEEAQHPSHDEDEHWQHEVLEGEQDAVALILGYLAMSALASWARNSHHECSHHGCHVGQICSSKEVQVMGAVGVGIFVSLIGYVFVKEKLARMSFVSKSRDSHIFHFRMLLAMIMAWCFEAFGEWIVIFLLPCLPAAISRLVSAAICTIFSFVCVLGCYKSLDSYQDHFEKHKAKKVAAAEKTDAESAEQSALLDHEENTIRSEFDFFNDLATGFASLVGIAWERCLQPLVDSIVSSPTLGETLGIGTHKVVYSLLISMLLVCIVLPGWMLHVLPMARKSFDAHDADIKSDHDTKIEKRRSAGHEASVSEQLT